MRETIANIKTIGNMTIGVNTSLGDQLRQRAAMGGERERAEFAAFAAASSI